MMVREKLHRDGSRAGGVTTPCWPFGICGFDSRLAIGRTENTNAHRDSGRVTRQAFGTANGETNVDSHQYERTEVECRACQQKLYEVGSYLWCNMERCNRYCLPVDHQGRTPDEAHADAIAPLFPDEGAESADEIEQADGVRQ